MLIPFVQLEFPGLIGLPEGRYLARDSVDAGAGASAGGERVLIVRSLGAPKPGARLRRGPRPVDPEDPTTVPVTRVTVAGVERFDGRSEAERWLEATSGDAERRGDEIRSAMLLLNRALNALRAAARDPLVQDAGATRALAIRIGYGSGDDVAEGRWAEARELARPRPGRLDDLDPQTRVAAVLAGRDRVHPAETLLERARLDTEQGRLDEARFGLDAARAALEQVPIEKPAKLRRRIEEAEDRLERELGG